LFEAFAGSSSLSLSLCPHSPLLLKLLLKTLLIILDLLDGLLFLHLLLDDPLLLLALTHLNDTLHQLLLLAQQLLRLVLILINLGRPISLLGHIPLLPSIRRLVLICVEHVKLHTFLEAESF
jgi:hypothetical protein